MPTPPSSAAPRRVRKPMWTMPSPPRQLSRLTPLRRPPPPSYYQTCLAAGTCREVAYDSYHGLTFLQLDARVSNTITIHDRYAVTLFYQMFNMTNRANYGPNYDVNVSNYTTASSSRSASSTRAAPLSHVPSPASSEPDSPSNFVHQPNRRKARQTPGLFHHPTSLREDWYDS